MREVLIDLDYPNLSNLNRSYSYSLSFTEDPLQIWIVLQWETALAVRTLPLQVARLPPLAAGLDGPPARIRRMTTVFSTRLMTCYVSFSRTN